MTTKQLQQNMITSWCTQGYITIIEKQTLEFMNKHTNVYLKENVICKSETNVIDVLSAVDPSTYRTVFEKAIKRG